MLATEPSTTSAMLGLLSPLAFEERPASCLMASFHHSDSSWDFNFDTFSDVPIYDEATTSTNRKESPCSAIRKPATKKEKDRRIDFNSSWPSARHLFAKVLTNSNNNSSSSSSSSSDHKQKEQQAVSPSPSSSSLASCEENDSKTSNKVRFAPTLLVRTHNMVLGDHPMCEDGLALQLGWDYEESKDIVTPLAVAAKNNSSTYYVPRWRQILRPHQTPNRNDGGATLLSVEERKRLLLKVGGCTEAELEKRRFCARFLLDYSFYEPPSSYPPKEQSGASAEKSTTTNKKIDNKMSSNGCRGDDRRDTPPRSSTTTPSTTPSPSPSARRGNVNKENPTHMPRVGYVRKSPPLYAAIA